MKYQLSMYPTNLISGLVALPANAFQFTNIIIYNKKLVGFFCRFIWWYEN